PVAARHCGQIRIFWRIPLRRTGNILRAKGAPSCKWANENGSRTRIHNPNWEESPASRRNRPDSDIGRLSLGTINALAPQQQLSRGFRKLKNPRYFDSNHRRPPRRLYNLEPSYRPPFVPPTNSRSARRGRIPKAMTNMKRGITVF